MAEWYNSSWANRIKLTINNANVGGANEIFDIGHETNDFSSYTSTVTDGGNLSISSAAALNGSNYGLSTLINDSNALDAYKNITKSTKLRYRFYFDTNSITMANTDMFVMHYTKQNGGGYGTINNLKLRYTTANGYEIIADVDGDTGWVNEYSVLISDAPHYVEWYITQATTSSSNDGTWQFWVDGVLQGSSTTLDNFNVLGDYDWFQQYGMIEGRDAGTSGTVYYDDIVANSDGAQIGPVVTDFPTYIDLSLLPADFHSKVNQTDARDIRITKADGTTELPREVVYYDSATDTGEVHFKYSGALSSSADTSFYIYYGNSGASDYASSNTYGAENVWDSNYLAVWHLQESGVGATAIKDSTANHKNSTSVTLDGAGSNPSATGKLGNADQLDGTNDAIDFPAIAIGTNTGTMETWFKSDTSPNSLNVYSLLSRYYDADSLLIEDDTGIARFIGYVGNNFIGNYNTTVSNSTWYHHAISATGTNHTLYRNGALTTDETASENFLNEASGWCLGAYAAGDHGNFFDGTLDEARLSGTPRSSTWLGTQFNNQNSPSTFYTIGSAELGDTVDPANPVAYWKFDEGVGTSAFDSSSNQKNLTFAVGTSSPSWVTSDQCVNNRCLNFSGNDYLTLGSTVPAVNTISLWVKSNNTAPAIIDFNGTQTITVSNNTVAANNFSSPTIYINGKVGTTISANSWNQITISTGTSFSATSLKIGKVASSFLTGYLDDIKIFSYVRTSDQVKQDYASGLVGMSSAKGANVNMGGSSTGKSLSDGLVGYWKMDESSWTQNCSTASLLDSSGNANSGKSCPSTTGPAGGGRGKYGSGGNFDGTNDVVRVEDSPSLDLSSFSASAWVYQTTNSGWRDVLFKGVDDTSNANYRISLYAGEPLVGFQQGADYVTMWSQKFMTLNTWNNITVTFDNTTKKLHCYVNGVLSDGDLVIASGTDTVITQTPSQNTDPLVFGSGDVSGTNANFSGSIDEIRIYNRALNQSEVKALYDYAPSPVGYWKMDEGNGTTTFDNSGNGNDATLLGTALPTWTNGQNGKAISFPGTDGRIATAATSSLELITNGTLEAWIYPAGSGTFLARQDGPNGNTTGYEFYYDHANKNVSLWRSGESPVSNNNVITPNMWNHVAAVISNNVATFYINGIASGSGGYTLSANGSSQISIGSYHGGSEAFIGKLDEVKIYNYARTAKQIIEDMGGSPAGAIAKAGPIAYYKFDENSGSTINNSGLGGSTYNGTFGTGTSSPSWTKGKINNGLSFDGSYDYVTSNLIPSVTRSGTYSISTWVYKTTSGDGEIVQNSNSSSDRNGLQIRNADARFGYYDGVSWYGVSGPITLNQWNHIVGVNNGGSLALYINGKLQTGTNQLYASFDNKLYLGKVDIDNRAMYAGIIDEVKIYNYALSSDEVISDYNQGASVVVGTSSQTIGATTTSLDYCLPGDTSYCANPIGEWNFNEGSGTTAFDTSGNGNNLVWSGTLGGQYVNGKNSKSGYFNGTNNDVGVTPTTPITSINSAITVESWVQLESGITADGDGIVTRDDFTNRIFNLNYEGATNNFRWRIWQSNGSSININGPATVATNTWYHLVGACGSNVCRLYINGQNIGTSTAYDGTILTHSAPNFEIGHYSSGSRFKGKIDDVRIYNYARSPAQVAYDYNQGAPAAWYKFDECSGSTINDWSGNNLQGTINIGASGSQSSLGTCTSGTGTSSAWTNGASGKINSSLNFDGGDDYAEIANDADMRQSNAVTVAAWIKANSLDDYDVIAAYGDNGHGDLRWNLNTATGDRLRFDVSYDGANTNSIEGNAAISTGVWHHVAATYNWADTRHAVLYIDGKQDAEATLTVTFTLFENPGPLQIGRRDNYTTTRLFSGQIDDFRIYNYALTATQVKSIFNGGSVNFR